jgi:hypothetical protein
MYVSFQILFQLEMINLCLCLSLFMLVCSLMILLLRVVMILVSFLLLKRIVYDVFILKVLIIINLEELFISSNSNKYLI